METETQSTSMTSCRIMEFEGPKGPGRLFNVTACLSGLDEFITEDWDLILERTLCGSFAVL